MFQGRNHSRIILRFSNVKLSAAILFLILYILYSWHWRTLDYRRLLSKLHTT